MICCVVCCCSYMYVYYFLCFFFFFFFFKQKTAYEMRISDWSSDVCSSDLAHRITSPWKWRHLKSVIVPSVQSPPSMLKLHDFCNRAARSTIQTVADINTITPGFRAGAEGGKENASISLRGIGQVPLGEASPGVVTY